jgi:carbamoyl-phosphate synthase small subunit
MTGYQEILTDPSYRGQIVVMTYPLVGNYGVNRTDVESAKPQVEGFVVRSLSPMASNWRQEETLEEWLKSQKTVALQGVDTRALTCVLREKGALKGMISTIDLDAERLVKKARHAKGLMGRDLVKEVNRENITNSEDFNRVVAKIKKEEDLLFRILRENRAFFLVLKPIQK